MLDQNEYINSLPAEKMALQSMTQKDHPLTPKESTLLRSIACKLNWLVQGTRPDMAFELIAISTKFRNGEVSDLVRGVKMIAKVIEGEGKIFFLSLSNTKHWKIVFSNAEHANLSDGVSSAGVHIVLLVGSGKMLPSIMEN